MKPGLTEREKRAISAIQHSANRPLQEVAKQARLKVSSLQYTIKTLEQRNILKASAPFLNTFILGFTDYQLYFSLSAGSKKTHAAVCQYFLNNDPVSWFSEIGGEYQYGATFCVRRIEEVSDFLDKLVKKFGNVFAQKIFSTCLGFTTLGRRYLLPESVQVPVFRRGLTGPMHRIDQDDHAILGSISSRPWVSVRDAAEQVKMPFSTVRRRIMDLEKAGVIQGYLKRVNLGGQGISRYRIILDTRGHSSDLTERLAAFARANPNINHVLECLGAWDYELGLEVFRSEDLKLVIQKLYAELGDVIATIKSFELLGHLKFSSYPRYKLKN